MKLLGLLLLVGSLGLPVSAHGTLLVGPEGDFMVGCPRAAAAVFRCVVRKDRWILPHLAVRTHFEYSRWVSQVSQLALRTPLWLASWLPVLDKSRGSKSAEPLQMLVSFRVVLSLMGVLSWVEVPSYFVQ